MNLTADKHLARARQDQLVIKEMPDEVLVYDLKTHQAHCLNKTAAFVWSQCDGATTAAAIADLMKKEYGKPVDEEVVWLALKQLDNANLLQERLVSEGLRFSRRQAIRKMGLTAALTLPLIASITSPAAAAAASGCTLGVCQEKGSTTANCHECARVGLVGVCYKNNGCGGGGTLGSGVSCSTCLDDGVPGALGGKSWVCTNC